MNHMNILLVTSDQQRWDTLGYLNPAIHTPNLDRMAAEGILFERAYTVNPVCTPSRCSMLTGQYPTRHGCFHVGTSLPEDYTPTVAKQLAEAGYFTGLLGKAHFQPCLDPNSLESAPRIHDLDFFRRWSGPYYGFQHAKLVIGHTSESHGCGMHYGAWLEDQGVPLEKYFGIHKYTHFGAWSLPEEYHGSRWVADETIAAVEMAQAKSKPFFLWASFQDPHNPYITPEPWDSMYAPDDMPLPEAVTSEMDDKPPFYQSLMSGKFYGDDPDLAHKGWGDCRIQPELTDAAVKSRDWALVEFRPSQGDFMQWTFIEEQYKLVLYRHRDYGELYDLQADPQQLRNLFAVPEYLNIRESLKRRFDPHLTMDEVVRERTAFA